MRRYEELKDRGIDTTFDEVLRDVIYRDKKRFGAGRGSAEARR
jgi:cytidylate kinase